MKTKEVRALSDSELFKTLEESREGLFRLRFRLATRQLDNFREIRRVRRTIARLLTIMRQRGVPAHKQAR